MSKKTKLIVMISSFCFVFATCMFSVFAVKTFSFNMGGSVEFVAPGIEATVSEATLLGISKKAGSGQMQGFTTTRDMTASQIASLDGVKSWTGISLLFDDDSEGKATIKFTVTNNSDKDIEHIMVLLSTNTTESSPIKATPSANACIAPKTSHTFIISLLVSNPANSVTLSGFSLTAEFRVVKSTDVLSIAQHKENGLNFEPNSTTPTAALSNYTGSSTSLEIPEYIKDESGNLYTVTEISDGTSSSSAFSSVKSTLKSVTFPTSLTKIGDYAFYRCGLTDDLVIPDSVVTIGIRAFYDCAITGVEIGNGVKTIGNSAFYECYNLAKLVIGNSIEVIGNGAFDGCSKITGQFAIPQSVVTIGDRAFANCVGLTGSLIIPNNVTTIGSAAFSNCRGLTGSLTIHNNVASIGAAAFSSCSGLTSLTIGNNVSTIEASAFYMCSSLASIKVLRTTPPTLGKTSCFDNTNDAPIYVPSGSVETYKTATNWSEYADRITAIV